MSSFSMVLLEQGVEMEMRAELPEVISILDREIPGFACEGYGYRLTSGKSQKSQLEAKWLLMVKLVHLDTNKVVDSPVGHLELEKLAGGMVRFKLPPRAEMNYQGSAEFDPEGTYYGSFIYHILNTFQRNELIHLPGVLPVL